MAPLGRRAWPLLGKLLRRFRAGEARSPLAGAEYAGAAAIDVTSAAFTDGGPIPQKHAGEGVGDNVSPELQWSGVPADAKQLVLIMDDRRRADADAADAHHRSDRTGSRWTR